MWNPLHDRSKTARAGRSKPTACAPNRVDELANSLAREDRAGELEQKLKELDPASLSPAEQESWWHLYGIVAFREGRDTEALSRFEDAHQRFPGSALIKFSLGQQYIRAGAIDKGFGLFRTSLFPEVPREYSLAQARYAYLWNRYADGLLYIRPFFQEYKHLKIADHSRLCSPRLISLTAAP